LNACSFSFSINLQTGKPGTDADIALHFNPRLDQNATIFNSKRAGTWANEEKQPLCIIKDDGSGATQAFCAGQSVQIVIKGEVDYYQIIVNGHTYARFHHIIRPEEVTHFQLSGNAEARSCTYHSKSVIIPPSQMYWRALGGGHFLQVETTSLGITWGLGYDNTAWVYTGGWGGAHFKGAGSQYGIFPIDDSKYFYVYENQRWNPLTGFTTHGLPTDRCGNG
jgi:tectonin beta-propeller repeat-containing protein 1